MSIQTANQTVFEALPFSREDETATPADRDSGLPFWLLMLLICLYLPAAVFLLLRSYWESKAPI